jgi:membrane fusion protein, multidrug efflux system
MYRKIAAILLIILVVLIGFRIHQRIQEQRDIKKTSGPEIIPVKVRKVEAQNLQRRLEYVGDVKAQDEALVYPKVTGKVIEKAKEEGNSVNKGEVIVYVDRDEVGLKFEKAPVESPLTGYVGRMYVDLGSSVNLQTAVASVVNLDQVKISVAIPEKYLPNISLGQEARIIVDAYPDNDFTGQVTMISPVLDSATRAAPVEITVANPGHELKSGMFARVNLIIQESEGVPAVLKEAVIGKTPNTYVFVIENNKAQLRQVTLGIYARGFYEIKEGINPGEQVVILGQQRLSDGGKVMVEE